MKKITWLLPLLFFAGQLCLAEIPKTISYQGVLKNTDSTPVTDGTYTITFKIYDVSTGGTPIWTEEKQVTINDGLFNEILGSSNPLDIPFDKQYWLGITVGDGAELKPLMKLTSSAYSLNTASVADNAITGSKIADGNIVRSINSLTDNINIAAGDNITISSDENILTISASSYVGNIVKSINSLTDNITLEEGDNISISQSDNTLTISADIQSGLTLADSSVTSRKIADGIVVRSINSLTENVTITGGDNITISQSDNTLTISSEGASELTLPYSGNTSSSENAFSVTATGTGNAGNFSISNENSDAHALSVNTTGTGNAIYSENSGTNGSAGIFYILNENNSSASFYTASFGGGSALNAYNHGTGVGGWFQINNPENTNHTLVSYNKGKGFAGFFYGYSKGVYITAPKDSVGLHVAGGTKAAVVATSQGARALYTEESTEVWFSDYGFGYLENGSAAIDIDPLFAETVTLEEPYHVFVQSYGNAELYVSDRTPESFEVSLREGETDVEFSYRIVAKRKDYEHTRLEHAYMADDDPNLYPEKRAVWEARKSVP